MPSLCNLKISNIFQFQTRVHGPTKKFLPLFDLVYFGAGLKNRAAWVAALLGPDPGVQDRKNLVISYDASGTKWVNTFEATLPDFKKVQPSIQKQPTARKIQITVRKAKQHCSNCLLFVLVIFVDAEIDN